MFEQKRKQNLSDIISVLVIFVLKTLWVQANAHCSRNDMYFKKSVNTKINATVDHIIEVKDVNVPELCLGICRNNLHCMSFNAVKIKNNIQCELLNGTFATMLPKTNLVYDTSSSYFELSGCNEKEKQFPKYAEDCSDIYNQGYRKNGIYNVIIGKKKVNMLCDLNLYGGRWSVIQKRYNGMINFQRDWLSYKNGFGDLASEFWFGNSNIYLLTIGKENQVLFVLKKFNVTENYYVMYKRFNVASENEFFKLEINQLHNFNATLTLDSMTLHRGRYFSTYDRDEDANDNCADKYSAGGWWFHECFNTVPNGLYSSTGICPENMGILWGRLTTSIQPLQEIRILVRKNLVP